MSSRRIMLDSTVFGNRSFIAWLILHADEFSVIISPVVYAETALWYLYSGLTVDDLEKDLVLLKAEVPDITREVARITAEKAYENRRALPFRHHARDYIIGAQAMLHRASLVTHNVRHFLWASIDVLTPEDLVKTAEKT